MWSEDRTEKADRVDVEAARRGFVADLDDDLADAVAAALAEGLRGHEVAAPPCDGDAAACRREALFAASLLERLADADRPEAGPLPEDAGPLR